MRKDILIATNLSLITGLGLSACKSIGARDFNPDSASKTPNSTEISPTQTEFAKITSATLESITNNEARKSIIDSLPANRPQSNGVEDVFSLKVGDKKFNFVMYELTEDEISNGVTIVNSEGLNTVQSVATYTEFEGYDGTKSWVRLIGITSKLDDPNIVWFYDPNGFPTEEREIDTKRAVFGYSINSKDNILFQPLITVPTSIQGYDYTQALSVILDGEVPGTMNINVMLIKPEAVSEAESAAIKLLDGYGVDPETYTLTEVDGVAVATDETGKEILRDGRFELGYAVELAKKDCESTGFETDNGSPDENIKDKDSANRYLEKLLRDVNYKPEEIELLFFNVLVDREKQCWGFADATGDALLYRDEAGLPQVIPTFFIFNR